WVSSISPTSGSVSSDTDPVVVTVDRTGLATGVHSFTFPVTSNAGTVNVTFNLTVAEVPVLTVDTGFTNVDGDPLAPLGDSATTLDFTITNTGTGTLNWNIDPDDFPTWLSMAPVAGSVIGAQVDTVRITVNRAGLIPGGYGATIPIRSNGGNRQLDVTMQVPLMPAIGVSPDTLDFGLTGNSSAFFVANVGDPGTVLNFLVVSDRLWLFNSPSTGTSIGTSSPIKDFQQINVSIDRSLLESTGATGTFTVYALDALGQIRPDIEPATVTVSVQATPLAFQTAVARTRIPSMLRWSYIMRDIRDQAFVVAPELLSNAFSIFEDGIAIEEPNETTQVVLLQNSTMTEPVSNYRTDLRTKIVLLLDYSGSMAEAANGLGTDITTLHETAGAQFIDNYFDFFANVEPGFAQMAIMEFHDRNAAATVVHGFTDDRAALQAALLNVAVTDHGATALLPAVESAALQLVNADFPLIPFDDADVRAVVVISDGRLTTPPGEIQDTVDALVAMKVRIFAVGWGEGVNHEPMARLSSGSGGHYYLSRLDANGAPTLANLLAKVDECNEDLASHTVLSYVSLGEEENVPIRFDGALNDPNDNPDQGVIQGSLTEQNIDLSAIVGDIRMGQISMRTPGIDGGTAEVTLRAEYIPRNLNQFEFTVTPTGYSIGIVPLEDGGLVDGWTLTPLGGGTYSLTAPTPADVLPYGAFGNLVRLEYGGVGAPFTVALDVDNTIYAGDPEPKYFVYPDTMDVDADPFLAPAFPTPLVDPTFVDFGTGLNSATVTVRNIGGSYPYGADPEVLLNWFAQDLPVFVTSVNPDNGSLPTTTLTDSLIVTVDRSIGPGTYTNSLNISYSTGTLGVFGAVPVLMRIQILPPVLSVTNTANLAFGNIAQGAGTQTATFNIANTGQSTLSWSIPSTGLPAWVESIIPSSGTTTDEVDTITVTVDPSVPGLGPQNTTFNVLSNGGNQLAIPISMTVTP
ncbi:MAG: VWA domain-containing protein, partial [Candidatus Hydrogenedentes bacterium]|nr:VWA domain-containing protein [Candidatus Hydrogenedentota bacterium]